MRNQRHRQQRKPQANGGEGTLPAGCCQALPEKTRDFTVCNRGHGPQAGTAVSAAQGEKCRALADAGQGTRSGQWRPKGWLEKPGSGQGAALQRRPVQANSVLTSLSGEKEKKSHILSLNSCKAALQGLCVTLHWASPTLVPKGHLSRVGSCHAEVPGLIVLAKC